MSEEKITWTVELKCDNCYHVWQEEVLRGYKIVRNLVCEDSLENPLCNNRELRCPNCGCTSQVKKQQPTLTGRDKK